MFLGWARQHHPQVYFIGGGGTDLLSRNDRRRSRSPASAFRSPSTSRCANAYPTRVRFKEFDFGIYRFVTPVTAVRRADARHRRAGRPAGGTLPREGARRSVAPIGGRARLSYLSLLGVPADARALVLWMDNGGRPAAAPPAEVEAFVGEVSLGKVVVGPACSPMPCRFHAEVAAAAASSPDAVTVRLRTATWNPRDGRRRQPTTATSVLWWTAWRFAARPDGRPPADVRSPRYLHAARALGRRPGRCRPHA